MTWKDSVWWVEESIPAYFRQTEFPYHYLSQPVFDGLKNTLSISKLYSVWGKREKKALCSSLSDIPIKLETWYVLFHATPQESTPSLMVFLQGKQMLEVVNASYNKLVKTVWIRNPYVEQIQHLLAEFSVRFLKSVERLPERFCDQAYHEAVKIIKEFGVDVVV